MFCSGLTGLLGHFDFLLQYSYNLLNSLYLNIISISYIFGLFHSAEEAIVRFWKIGIPRILRHAMQLNEEYLKKSILLNVAGFTAVTLLKMKPLSIDFLLSLLILCNEFYHQKVLWLPHWFTSIKIVIGKIVNTTITCNFLNIFPNSNYISLLRIFLSALFYSN